MSGDIDLAAADAKLLGESTDDYFGRPVCTAGDINGDGNDDVLVSAFPNNNYRGAVYVLYGPLSGDIDMSSADAVLEGVVDDDVLGHGAAPAGDVDGDGYDDILLGSPGDDTEGNYAGAAYLLYGPSIPSGLITDVADATMRAPSAEEYVGYDVAGAGDINGDGYDDLFIGAPSTGYDGGGYILFGGSE